MVALKARAGVSGNTVGKAEGAYPGSPPTPEQLAAIQEALEAAGVEFTNGDAPGVRLKADQPSGGMQVSELNAENDV
jgi:hypothetical protein